MKKMEGLFEKMIEIHAIAFYLMLFGGVIGWIFNIRSGFINELFTYVEIVWFITLPAVIVGLIALVFEGVKSSIPTKENMERWKVEKQIRSEERRAEFEHMEEERRNRRICQGCDHYRECLNGSSECNLRLIPYNGQCSAYTKYVRDMWH